MELAISKLTARRVIYYFEGYVKGERPKGLKFVFYNYDLKITIIPSVFEWDGDTFRMMLHVEQANENNPISSGDYYPIAVDGKGKQYPLQVAKSIIEEREHTGSSSQQTLIHVISNGNDLSGKLMSRNCREMISSVDKHALHIRRTDPACFNLYQNRTRTKRLYRNLIKCKLSDLMQNQCLHCLWNFY